MIFFIFFLVLELHVSVVMPEYSILLCFRCPDSFMKMAKALGSYLFCSISMLGQHAFGGSWKMSSRFKRQDFSQAQEIVMRLRAREFKCLNFSRITLFCGHSGLFTQRSKDTHNFQFYHGRSCWFLHDSAIMNKMLSTGSCSRSCLHCIQSTQLAAKITRTRTLPHV